MIEFLKDAYHLVTDVQGIIQWGGTLLVCAIIFAETGLFFGFFLPGDSLLVTAGVFAATGHLNLFLLLSVVSLCAVAGDQVGYLIGHSAGDALYRKDDSFFFRKKHLARAHEFYEKYGGKTIVLARFVPIIRTFAPAVAGAAKMDYRRFVFFNVFGGVLWVWSMVLIGYFLGSAIPGVSEHIETVIIIVVALSLMPGVIEWLRHRGKSGGAAETTTNAQM
ncbi:MAG: putative rane protein [Acidobacteria bacterium]|jgi:membrane-associated protein|nr:putative rane protein [Acidobacteriota bacterium]